MNAFAPRLTFRAKLLASNIVLVAAVVLLVLLQLSRSVGADMRRSLERRMEDQARGAAAWVSERRHVDKLAGRLAAVVHADVAIFDRDGRRVGASDQGEPSGPVPDQVGEEPELVSARAGVVGHATRPAPQLGSEMHYVAVPAEGGMIVRLALPLSEIDNTLSDLHRRLAFAFALAVVAAVALGVLASRLIARPLREMTDAAERIAGGDYDIQPPATSPDELGQLSRALASLAAQLRAKIADLVAERDRLSAMFAGMVEGVLVLDESGHVVLANPAAATVLGRALDGGALREVVADARLRAVIEAGLARREVQEAEIETGGEATRATAVYVRPLASGVVVVLRDMTRVRRLLAQRRDLVANVSHELRTPVTAVQGYAETLLQMQIARSDAQAREFLEIIHRHARRLGTLVEQLLELSELEVRAPDAAPRERVDLRFIADNVATTLAKRVQAEGVTLAVQVMSGAVAVGDPLGLEQVVENLVDNAIKYGRPRGTVRVHGGREADRVRLRVTDDGEGMDPRHLPHLFERFYRVDPSRSRERGGAGLGLAIVKHLVEAMGGTIEVESAPGAGTTFTVTLPAG